MRESNSEEKMFFHVPVGLADKDTDGAAGAARPDDSPFGYLITQNGHCHESYLGAICGLVIRVPLCCFP
jgi:hypothetical protein